MTTCTNEDGIECPGCPQVQCQPKESAAEADSLSCPPNESTCISPCTDADGKAICADDEICVTEPNIFLVGELECGGCESFIACEKQHNCPVFKC